VCKKNSEACAKWFALLISRIGFPIPDHGNLDSLENGIYVPSLAASPNTNTSTFE
jgi:hypothetical protein